MNLFRIKADHFYYAATLNVGEIMFCKGCVEFVSTFQKVWIVLLSMIEDRENVM